MSPRVQKQTLAFVPAELLTKAVQGSRPRPRRLGYSLNGNLIWALLGRHSVEEIQVRNQPTIQKGHDLG